MSSNFTVIIPARLQSTRLERKVLQEIANKPLLQHVYESALASEAGQVIIATDNQEIKDIAEGFGAVCVMTSNQHTSGTDRIAEAARALNIDDSTAIINLQGDEMGMPGELINQVAALLIKGPNTNMSTLCEEIIDTSDINDPNIVKVVMDHNQQALYFSRAPIPWRKQTEIPIPIYRHIGIYGYRADFLQKFTQLEKSPLEQAESLEQLRALYHGFEISVGIANVSAGYGIDTELDLMRARSEYNN